MSGPEPYSDRTRLAAQVDDAREALADDSYGSGRADLARRVGRLEALLSMIADSAAAVLAENQRPGAAGGSGG